MVNKNIFTLDKLGNFPLIKDVVVKPLKVNRDSRGVLVETLKKDWQDVYSENNLNFCQNYYSITEPGVARDENQWHYHPTKQIDRFVVMQGDLMVVLYDWRKKSETHKYMNWFQMGESNGDNGQYLLLIPKNVLHCFIVTSKKPALLMNFPSQLYDPDEEGRVAFKDVKICGKDETFDWTLIRNNFNIKTTV
jgi:dTDP-4-dehydrorhamnose 3,5-epimerase